MNFLKLFNKKQYKIKAKNRKKIQRTDLFPWSEGRRDLNFKSEEDSYKVLQYLKMRYQDIDIKKVVIDHMASNNFKLSFRLKMIDFMTLDLKKRLILKCIVIYNYIKSKLAK